MSINKATKKIICDLLMLTFGLRFICIELNLYLIDIFETI